MFKLLFLLLLLLSQLQTRAQVRQYLFSHLGIRDGLLSEHVARVQQDSKGFLWIGSNNGLQRYDGHRFLNFRHIRKDSTTIPEEPIYAMHLDSKDRLWLMFGFSMGYFNTQNFTFHHVPIDVPAEVLKRHKGSLYIDRNNNVLLTILNYGVLGYDEQEKQFTSKRNPVKMPPGWKPNFVWQDNAGQYWMGSDSGLVKYHAAKNLLSYSGHNPDKDPFIDAFKDLRSVVYMHIDKTARAWVIAWPHTGLAIRSCDRHTGKLLSWERSVQGMVQGYFEPRGITELSDGSLWWSGINLFAKLNPERTVLENVPNDMPGEFRIRYDGVHSMFEDREKNVWVCTDKVVYRFNPTAQVFSSIQLRRAGKDSIYNPEVTGCLQTSDGNILVSTWGMGIFPHDKNFNPVNIPHINEAYNKGETAVWCMVQRSNGDIWRGCQHGLLFIYHAAARTTEKLVHPIFENSTIRQVATDTQGNLWFGTHRGHVIKWTASTNTFTLVRKLDQIIRRMIADSSGYVWACTEIDGIYRINAATNKIAAHYTTQGQPGKVLSGHYTSDIIQYNDSLFIITGKELNILNVKNNSFRYYTTEAGLPFNNVSNLVKDARGLVWISSGSGIISFDPVRGKFRTYNSLDGIHTYTFSHAASTRLSSGRIVFGTVHDILIFDPDRATAISYPTPKVEISRFAVMNKPLSLDSLRRKEVIELRHHQNSLVIDFTTLTFQDIRPVFYKLAGLETEWKEDSKAKQAIYNYLPPGNYTFMAGCMGPDGNIININSMRIHISAPFWKTWWFYSMLALAAAALLYWFDHERMQRKEALQKMRSDIAGSLHEKVNTALNNINLLSAMATMKADKDPQKSKEFLEQIHSKSQNMIIVMDDMLWSLSPENDSMQKTIERMKEFIQEMQNRHGINVELQVDKNVESLGLNMKLRHDAFLLFRHGIENLVKAGATDCMLHLGSGKHELLFTMQFDNGNGTMRALTNLLQTQEMEKHLRAMKVRLDVQVTHSVATIVIKIPLN
ncbi:MAG TPA: two-component regulator propeller domain-containing protein [Chitinophagaceae bacterium]|nr:two-component regulator propeller domain-containing protein [Chitinophagaceae bacterium]